MHFPHPDNLFHPDSFPSSPISHHPDSFFTYF
jgi:hypothetical protein